MYSAMHILLFGLICDPDHLCFGRTTYNNINGPGGPFMLVIIGPAGPFMYPDQISRYRPQVSKWLVTSAGVSNLVINLIKAQNIKRELFKNFLTLSN